MKARLSLRNIDKSIIMGESNTVYDITYQRGSFKGAECWFFEINGVNRDCHNGGRRATRDLAEKAVTRWINRREKVLKEGNG